MSYLACGFITMETVSLYVVSKSGKIKIKKGIIYVKNFKLDNCFICGFDDLQQVCKISKTHC